MQDTACRAYHSGARKIARSSKRWRSRVPQHHGEIMEVVQVSHQELVELTVKTPVPRSPMTRTTVAMKPSGFFSFSFSADTHTLCVPEQSAGSCFVQ